MDSDCSVVSEGATCTVQPEIIMKFCFVAARNAVRLRRETETKSQDVSQTRGVSESERKLQEL